MPSLQETILKNGMLFRTECISFTRQFHACVSLCDAPQMSFTQHSFHTWVKARSLSANSVANHNVHQPIPNTDDAFEKPPVIIFLNHIYTGGSASVFKGAVMKCSNRTTHTHTQGQECVLGCGIRWQVAKVISMSSIDQAQTMLRVHTVYDH